MSPGLAGVKAVAVNAITAKNQTTLHAFPLFIFKTRSQMIDKPNLESSFYRFQAFSIIQFATQELMRVVTVQKFKLINRHATIWINLTSTDGAGLIPQLLRI